MRTLKLLLYLVILLFCFACKSNTESEIKQKEPEIIDNTPKDDPITNEDVNNGNNNQTLEPNDNEPIIDEKVNITVKLLDKETTITITKDSKLTEADIDTNVFGEFISLDNLYYDSDFNNKYDNKAFQENFSLYLKISKIKNTQELLESLYCTRCVMFGYLTSNDIIDLIYLSDEDKNDFLDNYKDIIGTFLDVFGVYFVNTGKDTLLTADYGNSLIIIKSLLKDYDMSSYTSLIDFNTILKLFDSKYDTEFEIELNGIKQGRYIDEIFEDIDRVINYNANTFITKGFNIIKSEDDLIIRYLNDENSYDMNSNLDILVEKYDSLLNLLLELEGKIIVIDTTPTASRKKYISCDAKIIQDIISSFKCGKIYNTTSVLNSIESGLLNTDVSDIRNYPQNGTITLDENNHVTFVLYKKMLYISFKDENKLSYYIPIELNSELYNSIIEDSQLDQ